MKYSLYIVFICIIILLVFFQGTSEKFDGQISNVSMPVSTPSMHVSTPSMPVSAPLSNVSATLTPEQLIAKPTMPDTIINTRLNNLDHIKMNILNITNKDMIILLSQIEKHYNNIIKETKHNQNITPVIRQNLDKLQISLIKLFALSPAIAKEAINHIMTDQNLKSIQTNILTSLLNILQKIFEEHKNKIIYHLNDQFKSNILTPLDSSNKCGNDSVVVGINVVRQEITPICKKLYNV
jgi:hypothetical protein